MAPRATGNSRLAACLLGLLPNAALGGGWSMICGNAAHSSRNLAAESKRTLRGVQPWGTASGATVKWKAKVGGDVESSPVISDDKVFTADKHMVALDRETGKLLWSYKLEADSVASGVLGGGLYMVGSDDKHFYAVDQETGELRWKFKAGGVFTGGATVDEEVGVVYVGSGDGLYAHGFDGSRRFKVPTKELGGGAVSSSPSLDLQGNVLFGDDAGYVWKVDRKGSVLWKKQMDSTVRSPMVVMGPDEILLSSGDPDDKLRGQLVRMREDGEVVWASTCGGEKNWCDSCWTAPQPVGDVVVAGCGLDSLKRGQIWGVDRNSGDLLWKVEAENDCQTSSPVHLAKDMVVLGCTDGKLYAVNARTGSVVWTFQAGGGIWTTPALDDDGTLYMASHDGYLYALLPKSGHHDEQL